MAGRPTATCNMATGSAGCRGFRGVCVCRAPGVQAGPWQGGPASAGASVRVTPHAAGGWPAVPAVAFAPSSYMVALRWGHADM